MRIGIAILAAVFPADINALGFIFYAYYLFSGLIFTRSFPHRGLRCSAHRLV